MLSGQRATLMVFVATVALTAMLFVIVPKGFFPVQDTGLIIGVTEAPQTISFAELAETSTGAGEGAVADPAVKSLSSFVGVDGTNVTPNSGRLQINLKPLASGATTSAP